SLLCRAGIGTERSQPPGKLRTRPGEPRAHGADIDAADLRRIRIRELGELAEDEHVAVMGCHAGERAPHELGGLAAHEVLERRVALDVLLEWRRVVAEALGIGRNLALARGLAREVARDAAQPARERSARGVVLAGVADEGE